MRTLHSVRQDFQAGNGVGFRSGAENEIAVALIGAGVMRAFRHQDHAAENAAGFIVKHIGIKQVAGGSAVKVLLAGPLVQLLVFLQMVGGKQADSCAVSVQDADRLLPGPGCAGMADEMFHFRGSSAIIWESSTARERLLSS